MGKESEGTQGKWVTSAGKWFKDEAEDIGIQTGEDSRFFGISASFDSFSNAGKELIVQYQAKYEKDIECGGGYVKLGPKMDDPTASRNQSQRTRKKTTTTTTTRKRRSPKMCECPTDRPPCKQIPITQRPQSGWL